MESRSILDLIEQAAAEQWEELDLTEWQLTELPPQIGKLIHLKYLIAGKWEPKQWRPRGIGLQNLPSEIKYLVNLKACLVPGNQLTEIPEQIAQLSQLETLDLSSNQITTIPESISKLTNLTQLSLWRNQITTIPESIGNLSNLTRLNLSENQITTIPESISKLTNLTQLSLWQNQINTIPESIGNLSNLTRLDLWWNQITAIPESIEKLSNLTRLDLSGNQITTIPESISKLTNLTQLNLSENQITAIPESIEKFFNLTQLYLSGNQIITIPESIGKLSNLTQLDLSGNQIITVPESIGKLSNLTQLYLSENQINAIPESIGKLSNLTRLDLWWNQITAIPESIGKLSNLTHLCLFENQISTIPNSIGQLTSLIQLDLFKNQISAIPNSIGQLTSLIQLDLFKNQISAIPNSIGQLTSLTQLNLSENQISQLPEALKNLDELSLLKLDSNPLSIPPEILRQGWGEEDYSPGNPKAILDYYFTIRDPNQTQNLYEVKLLLVGEGEAGKTSLANKILNSDYVLTSGFEDTSTRGIDILKWEFTGRDGNSYSIKIWDFGGQEIYHQTHQFFLTERSLYLLVADNRRENTDHDFWLNSIQILSNNSPVLLIQNEKQDRTCNLDVKRLRGQFENLRETYRINLADNRGLAELKSAIQHEIEKLIPNGIPFPNKWMAVRYTLVNDGRNYIDCTEYEAICRHHGIMSREEMLNLSRFLHELGICLHFQRDPILRYRLILKPNWGTAAVYKILDNATVKQNLGQFSDADLDDIWSAPEYADMRDSLLQLLKEFKVCYEIPRRKGHYIAPHLLSAEAPTYSWDDNNNLILRYHYPAFMPKGILTRFIVEMHQDIENVSDPENAPVWQSGVILTNGSARAQIIESYPQRQISIHVTGNRSRDFLTIINRKFQEIHNSFDDRLNYDTLIPCNCATCKNSQAPYTFPLDRLYQRIDRRMPTIECHESGEQVNVRGLIDGVILDDPKHPEIFDLEEREFLTGKHFRDRVDHRRHPQPEPNNTPHTVNVSVTVPINNQQEQTMSNDQIWNGDRFSGDKVMGDKVAGNKMQINTVQGDAVAGNKFVTSQNLPQAAQDIKALLDQLAIDYPNEGDFVRAGRAIEAIKQNPTLKQRVTNALKESGTTAVEKAIESVTENPIASIIIAGVKGFIDAEG